MGWSQFKHVSLNPSFSHSSRPLLCGSHFLSNTACNLQVRFWLYRYGVLPSGLAKSADDLWGFALDMAVTVPATFSTAYVSYKLVELPAAKAARRIEHKLFGSSSGGSSSGDAPAANGHVVAKAA